jgi:hypothetical protein
MALASHAAAAEPSLRELASGVDALYLSGRAQLDERLFEVLEERRCEAVEVQASVPFELGGFEFLVKPRAMGKYRYWLDHPFGAVALTKSDRLPPLRVQPRAEHLHGIGPRASLAFFDGIGEVLAAGPVAWSLSRLDLFCDVQGWSLHGDDRHRFVCRASRRDLHEHGEAFGGFEFGRRTTKTVCARIYDKTAQIDAKGIDWWPDVWGEAFDASRPVLRVEFEIGREGLREYGVNSPTDGLDRAADLWASVTDDWLTYRTPTGDDTKSRWPIDGAWSSVQRASLRAEAVGMDRVRAGLRRGDLRRLTPALVGYLASVGAVLGMGDLDSTLAAVRYLVQDDERRRGVAFTERIAERRGREPVA